MKRTGKKSKTFVRNVTLIIAAVIIGVALFTSVFVAATVTNGKDATQALEKITAYVKKQCVLEDEATLENEAKSLVNLVDKAREARNYIEFDRLDETEDSLNKFVTEHRLSGIILTDDNVDGRIAGFYGSDGTTAEDWFEPLYKYRAAKNNPIKSYSERMTTANGEYIDFAVVGRNDRTGLILCYARQNIEFAVTLQYSIKEHTRRIFVRYERYYRRNRRYKGSCDKRRKIPRTRGRRSERYRKIFGERAWRQRAPDRG